MCSTIITIFHIIDGFGDHHTLSNMNTQVFMLNIIGVRTRKGKHLLIDRYHQSD